MLLRMQVKRATEARLDSPLVTKLRQRRWRSATEATGNDNSRKTELFQTPPAAKKAWPHIVWGQASEFGLAAGLSCGLLLRPSRKRSLRRFDVKRQRNTLRRRVRALFAYPRSEIAKVLRHAVDLVPASAPHNVFLLSKPPVSSPTHAALCLPAFVPPGPITGPSSKVMPYCDQ